LHRPRRAYCSLDLWKLGKSGIAVMQQPQPTAANHLNSPFVGSLSQPSSLLTRKRVSLILVGAILFAAAGYAIGSEQRNTTKPQILKIQKASASTEPTQSLDSNISANGTDPPPPAQDSQNQTKVSVNGQNIPVPANGTTSRTIASKSGQTTVNVSNSSSSSQSSSGASSSNSFKLNVNSSSESSSGTNN
jgi:hypothetical protein